MRSKYFLVFLLISFFTANSFGKTSDELKYELKKNRYLVSVKPNDPLAHFNLAMTYAYTGYVDEGFEELKIVNKLDANFAQKTVSQNRLKIISNPSEWHNYFYNGFTCYFIGNKKEAMEMFKKVLELKPEDEVLAWTMGYMAVLYADQKNFKDGIDLLKKAILLEPEGAYLHLALGFGYKETGNILDATKHLLKGARLKATQKKVDEEL